MSPATPDYELIETGRSPWRWILPVGFAVVVGGIVLVLSAGGSGEDDGPLTAREAESSEGSPTGSGNAGIAIGEHWHALLGINVCGQWEPPIPAFESATGIHSHGDQFVHLHPFSEAGAGRRATLGLFVSQAGGSVSATALELPGRPELADGGSCDGRPARLRWVVNGIEQTGDPAAYVFADQDVVALALLPADQPVGDPPGAGTTPSDVSS